MKERPAPTPGRCLRLRPLFLAAFLAGFAARARALELVEVPMPGGGAGIGFDDMLYAPDVRRLLVPGGRTGKLFLVDPQTRQVSSVSGFSAKPRYRFGHEDGPTSADACGAAVFVIDRDARSLTALDAETWRAAAVSPLAGEPDYVRCRSGAREAWVTEPDQERIEVFSVASATSLVHEAFIPVPGGPESLVIDEAGGRAYTQLWKGASAAISLSSRAVVGRWPNGCSASRGIALDSALGLLFSGCAEGAATAVSLRSRALVSRLSSGEGVDIIAYNPKLRRLYAPGARSETLAIIAVDASGRLTLARRTYVPSGAHCVASDDNGGVWICDPRLGRLGTFKDEP